MEDDGGGIDIDKVRRKAIEAGMMMPIKASAAQMKTRIMPHLYFEALPLRIRWFLLLSIVQ